MAGFTFHKSKKDIDIYWNPRQKSELYIVKECPSDACTVLQKDFPKTQHKDHKAQRQVCTARGPRVTRVQGQARMEEAREQD